MSGVFTERTPGGVATRARDALKRPATALRPAGAAVLLLGPARTAASGVATHINHLFASPLARTFRLSQFQVGSEGRRESRREVMLRLLFSPLALAIRVLREKTQIVHINTSLDLKGYWRDLMYLAVAKTLRCKVVYQIHGGALPAQFFPNSPLLTSLLRRVLGWADVVVLLAKSEMHAYREFAPRACLVRIANCVPIEDAISGAESRNAGQQPLAVAYIGRLTTSKGILETIEAVRMLRERGVDTRLTIAGFGAAVEAIQRAVAAGQLADRVRLVGEVFGAAKRQLWAQTDVLALPTYREGLPYALLEAMACGVVPVASPVGAIPDVVQDEVHGLLVPPRDPAAVAQALERLARDRPLLRRLACAAREHVVTHYSVARLGEEFARLYEGLLEQRAGH
jgi:glycosyltransferase involved in cell wall biosynthesis